MYHSLRKYNKKYFQHGCCLILVKISQLEVKKTVRTIMKFSLKCCFSLPFEDSQPKFQRVGPKTGNKTFFWPYNSNIPWLQQLVHAVLCKANENTIEL